MEIFIHSEKLLSWSILFRDNLVSIRLLLNLLLLLKFFKSATTLFSGKLPCFLEMILSQICERLVAAFKICISISRRLSCCCCPCKISAKYSLRLFAVNCYLGLSTSLYPFDFRLLVLNVIN